MSVWLTGLDILIAEKIEPTVVLSYISLMLPEGPLSLDGVDLYRHSLSLLYHLGYSSSLLAVDVG